MNIHIISLEGFDERLGHAVGANRREAGNGVQLDRKVDRFMGPIAAAIVREPLDQMRQRRITKAPLDALHHQIRDHFSGDPANAGTPAHDFSIAGIECKGHANDLPVPAGDLQTVGGPAKVQPDRDDLDGPDSS